MRRLPAPAILALACLGPVAHADELSAYAGELLGGPLTNQPLSGALPRLADHLTYGARYDHDFTPIWGLELAAEQTRTRTARQVQPGVSDVRLRAAELDLTWNFTHGGRITGYTLMGAGYARAHLDPDLAGIVDGVPTLLAGKGAATANLGMGARVHATGSLVFRAEVRGRFMERIVAPGGRGLGTLEATAGLGLRF